MNYLHSLEYTEEKDQLSGDYCETFQTIENYYIHVNTEQSYEVQLTLSQILGDFLEAQKDGKPLERIIGNDTKKYAVRMLKAEYDIHKGKGYWISTAIIFCWLVLFMMFAKTFYINELSGFSFMKRTEHIYFSIDILIFSILPFICYYIRTKLMATFFYRPKVITLIKILTILPISFVVIYYLQYSKPENSKLAIRVPEQLFLILALLTTVYTIIAIVVAAKNTRKKNNELEVPELIPEQILCPSCGREQDCDYPKCPYCGHKNTALQEKL